MLTPAEAATADDGATIVTVGSTADGPVIEARWSGPCVFYLEEVTHTKVVSSEYEEVACRRDDAVARPSGAGSTDDAQPSWSR